MHWYYEYLKLYRDGKPMSQWVIKALDRVPYYLSHYNYNERYPKRLISFMENSLYLQKGDTSSKMKLEIEQKFWIELLGFEYDDGRPVITDLGLIIGAGSGKSTFMAGLSLAVMIVDSHRGQDVLVMSNSVNQSQNTFRTATDMVSDDRSPLYDFKKMDLIQPIQGKIRWTPTNSQIEIKAMDKQRSEIVQRHSNISDTQMALDTILSKKVPDNFLELDKNDLINYLADDDYKYGSYDTIDRLVNEDSRPLRDYNQILQTVIHKAVRTLAGRTTSSAIKELMMGYGYKPSNNGGAFYVK